MAVSTKFPVQLRIRLRFLIIQLEFNFVAIRKVSHKSALSVLENVLSTPCTFYLVFIVQNHI